MQIRKFEAEKEERRMTQPSPTELIVALDYPRADRAWDAVKALEGLPVILKVGSELFLAAGPEFVRELVHQKHRVFLDLKFHDIPNTVAKAVRQAALMHVEMLTVHLSGGSAMLRAVKDELDEIPTLRPKILGVSVLTSFDDVHWAQVTKAMTGHPAEVASSVDGMIEHATAWGADGVVCSPLELRAIRESFPGLMTVVPGIRPEGMQSDDQARVMTPAQAHKAGASAIVVGRPITQAESPKKMVEQILSDLG